MADASLLDNAEKRISLVIEFSGGLELLFGNEKKHHIELPCRSDDGHPANMDFLVRYLCDNLIRDRRKDMFVVNGTIRPGILVLINDADWELEGEGRYEVKGGDIVLFVSTLHGG